jgi:fumarate hydratase class I
LTREEVATWQAGDRLLLNGTMLTGRDAAHKRIADHSARGESLPDGADFTNRVIYYTGPVDPVRDEVIGPAGPTTATRMDKFTHLMLGMEAIYEFDVKDMPVTVAVDARGVSVHHTGPKHWRAKIGKIPVTSE